MQALRKMAECERGLTSQQFAEALGQPVAKLGPVIRGITRRIPAFHYFVEQRRERDPKGRGVRRYALTESGRRFVQGSQQPPQPR